MTVGGDRFVVVLSSSGSPVTLTAVDNNDGTYTVTFTVTATGSYTLSIASTTGVALANSPFAFTVVPGAADLNRVIFTWISPVYTAGNTLQFSLVVRDQYDNIRTGDTVAIQFTYPTSTQAQRAMTTISYSESNGAHTVTFTVIPAGGYTMSILVGGQAVPSPVQFTLAPLPAPVVSGAQFSDSGSRIYVTFDRDTNQAGSGCGDVLDFGLASIGTGAYCFWQDHQTYVVVLGSGADVVPSDNVAIVDDVVYTIYSNSLPVQGALVAIAAPADPVVPSPSLIAPTTVPACDNLTLDASLSTGSGSRPLVFAWSVTPALANVDITTLTDAVIDITGTELTASQPYDFTVTVTNWLGQSDSVTVTITRSNVDVPRVTVSSTYVTVTRSERVIIQGRAQVPSCASQTGLTFSWTSATTIPAGVSTSARDIIIPANSLSIGTHVFTLTVAYVSDSTITASVDVTVEVVPSAPTVSIVGGDRTVYAGSAFSLVASAVDVNMLVSPTAGASLWA